MRIDREQALQLVTDRLCGELDAKGAAELQAYIKAHPDFAEEVKELETAWRKLDLLTEKGEGPAMGGELHRALGHGDESDELSDEDLDLAAGGLSRTPPPEDD